MKKLLIFLSLSLIVLSFFAYKTADPAIELTKKLTKFSQMDNIYYQSEFKFNDSKDASMIIKQFRRGGNYNAKIIFPLSKFQNVVVVKDGMLSYKQMFMIIEGSVEESKKSRSLFWFDKINPEDIKNSYVKKIKTSNKICTMYNVQMKNGRLFDICVNKENFPVYIKYYNLTNFTPLLFDINSSAKKQSEDVIIEISDIQINPLYDSSFDLPNESKFAIKTKVKDIKEEINEQN